MSLVARVNNQSLTGIKGCSRLPVASHVGVLSAGQTGHDSSAGIHTTSTSLQISVPTTRILCVPRPLTPFMQFSQETMPKVKLENPNANIAVIMKTIGQRWASAPKQSYTTRYQTLMKEHEQKVAHAAALRKKLAPLLQKPGSGFTLFIKEKAKTVQGKGQEKLKNMATQWNQLTAEQKNKYISEAKNQEMTFSEKLGKLSSEESSALQELTFERRVNRLKRIGKANRRKILHQLAAQHQRPKKPLVGFVGFMKQNWATLPKGTLVEKMKVANAKWKALPAAEKQKQLNSAKVQMEQYKKDVAAWESNMTATGHKDVVLKFHSRDWKAFLPEGVRVVPFKKRVMSPEVRMKRLEKKRAAKAKKMQLKRERKQLRKKLAAGKKPAALKKKMQTKAGKKSTAKKAVTKMTSTAATIKKQ